MIRRMTYKYNYYITNKGRGEGTIEPNPSYKSLHRYRIGTPSVTDSWHRYNRYIVDL